jgi:hypothetical protein
MHERARLLSKLDPIQTGSDRHGYRTHSGEIKAQAATEAQANLVSAQAREDSGVCRYCSCAARGSDLVASGRGSCRTVERETVQGDGFDALAAAHSRALAKMSGDIAAAIRAEAEEKS